MIGEPQGPVGAGRDPLRSVDARSDVVRERPSGGDPPDRAALVAEPQGPVGPDRDRIREHISLGKQVVGDHTGSGNPPDRVVVLVGEPQGAVGPGRDPGRNGDAGVPIVGDRTGDGDPPDRVAGLRVGEPQSPVGACSDPIGLAHAGVGVVGDSPAGGDAPDRVVGLIGKPEITVGPDRDPLRAANGGVRVIAYHPGARRDLGGMEGADASRPGHEKQDSSTECESLAAAAVARTSSKQRYLLGLQAVNDSVCRPCIGSTHGISLHAEPRDSEHPHCG